MQAHAGHNAEKLEESETAKDWSYATARPAK